MSYNKENVFPLENKNKSKKSKKIKDVNQKDDVNLSKKLESYVNYVKTLEDCISNLKKENQDLEDRKYEDFEQTMNGFRVEIKALRKAYDDSSSENSSLFQMNAKLKHEINDLKENLMQTKNDLNNITKENEALEHKNISLNRSIKDYNILQRDYNLMLEKNNKICEELERMIETNSKLQSSLDSLTDKHSFCSKSHNRRSTYQDSFTSEHDTYKEKQIIEEYELKHKNLLLSYESRENKLIEEFNKKNNEMENINSDLFNKYRKVLDEIKLVKQKNDELFETITQKNTEINELNNIINQYSTEIIQFKKERDNILSETLNDNEKLNESLQMKTKECSKILKDKLYIEKELNVFRNMLDSEQSRCNLETSLPKRRKVAAKQHQMNNFFITASSNDCVKMACCDDYTGKNIWIENDGELDLCMKDWNLQIIHDNGGEDIRFAFDSIMLKSKQKINLWSSNEQIVEDENNIKVQFNFPINQSITCNLLNNIGLVEASFELNRLTFEHKPIIMATRNKLTQSKTECSIM